MTSTSEEIPREYFRAMMFYDWKRKLSIDQCHRNLCEAFPGAAPNFSTVSYWYREFQRGRRTFEDEPHPGRPSEVVCPANILCVENLVRAHRNITVREIEEALGIGSSSVSTILHDHLGLRKISSRWIPHKLTNEQKQQRVDWCRFMISKFDGGRSKSVGSIVTGDETWIYSYDPETKQQSAVWVFDEENPPTKVVRSRSAGKRMVAVFFRRQGLVKIVPLVEQCTVTAAWYSSVCLPAVFNELNSARPKTGLHGLLLHHDNASAHTAARTVDFLHQSGVQLVPHPPYSPDLSPCDFFLFPKVKRLLKGKRFPNADSAVDAFRDAVQQLSVEDWSACFSDWFHRMNSCMRVDGEYFEKM